jgi:hypothetical protein
MHDAYLPTRGKGSPAPYHASETCMFCDSARTLRGTGEDPMGFLAHLRERDDCRTEYELWKQVITDEWHGD